MKKNVKKGKKEKTKTEAYIMYDCCYDPCCYDIYWGDVCCC
jgi:hypothetical protein